MGDSIEELYEFDEDLSIEKIKDYWSEYNLFLVIKRDKEISFEEFMHEYHSDLTCNRVFVDLIYV